jgi:hypothetical protein
MRRAHVFRLFSTCALVALSACSKRSPVPVPDASTVGASTAAGSTTSATKAPRSADERAADHRDTSGVITALNPRWCRVKNAEGAWEKAHDEGHSYAAAIAAIRAVSKAAKEEAAKPDVAASNTCASAVRREYLNAITSTPKAAEEAISCLEKHRAEIEAKLRKGGLFLDAAPSECSFSVPLFSDAMSCTREITLCMGKPCEWFEIASHVGAACDPKENVFSPSIRAR